MDAGGLIQVLESLSLLSVILWIGSKVVDAVLSHVIDKKFISELLSRGWRGFKIYRTKYRPIGASFEYSITLKESASIDDSKRRIKNCVYQCEELSRENLKVVRFDWTNEATATVQVSYISEKDMSIEIRLMPDHSSFSSATVESILDADLSSIGININFQFEFHNLRGSILNLSNLADFLSRSIGSEFEAHSISNSTITVSSLDDSLTLDDWIKERQFDVSLLLRSEDEERSVEFTGDRAVISSPYTGVDDTTAEYIEATLLNYYL